MLVRRSLMRPLLRSPSRFLPPKLNSQLYSSADFATLSSLRSSAAFRRAASTAAESGNADSTKFQQSDIRTQFTQKEIEAAATLGCLIAQGGPRYDAFSELAVTAMKQARELELEAREEERKKMAEQRAFEALSPSAKAWQLTKGAVNVVKGHLVTVCDAAIEVIWPFGAKAAAKKAAALARYPTLSEGDQFAYRFRQRSNAILYVFKAAFCLFAWVAGLSMALFWLPEIIRAEKLSVFHSRRRHWELKEVRAEVWAYALTAAYLWRVGRHAPHVGFSLLLYAIVGDLFIQAWIDHKRFKLEQKRSKREEQA